MWSNAQLELKLFSAGETGENPVLSRNRESLRNLSDKSDRLLRTMTPNINKPSRSAGGVGQ